ncbi:MAG: DNA-3-methyladenine glycosylase I [Chloroflexi bacterium]|nr:MAG: DNA-3-methyladenine glycosylase I [Chloroflexota bacterium]
MADSGRCWWAGADPLMVVYHDTEWGVPCHDDRELFERLMLECFQDYGEPDFQRLLADPGIVRNRLKVYGAAKNARGFLTIQDEAGSFDRWLWNWVDGCPVRVPGRTFENTPSSTPLSDAISKDLKKRGFTFVGTTIIYAFLQSVGVVDDHDVGCFRYQG